MTDEDTSAHVDAGFADSLSTKIPVLSSVVPQEAVSQAMRAALDAREKDQFDWMSMESHLLQTLRPELERMSTELVRRGLREAWRRRFNGPI
jgi:hypothetical protein